RYGAVAGLCVSCGQTVDHGLASGENDEASGTALGISRQPLDARAQEVDSRITAATRGEDISPDRLAIGVAEGRRSTTATVSRVTSRPAERTGRLGGRSGNGHRPPGLGSDGRCG